MLGSVSRPDSVQSFVFLWCLFCHNIFQNTGACLPLLCSVLFVLYRAERPPKDFLYFSVLLALRRRAEDEKSGRN